MDDTHKKPRRAKRSPQRRRGTYAGWRCHDCGKPASTYRCSDCKEKWLRKHGISLEGAEPYEDAY